jgi:hypothetical protein
MTAKQAIWSERVREWKQSGKTLREFTAGQPYNPLTLRWWASELRRQSEGGGRRRGGQRATGSIKLARVIRSPAVQPESRAMAVEVSGARIMVERGFDAALLSEVVRALGGTR